MKRRYVLILLGCLLALTHVLQARQEGFTPLFNGKDLTGWVYGTRNGAPNKTGPAYTVVSGDHSG